MSIVARRLGTKVSVISKVGSDFPAAYFRQLVKENVELTGVTTTNHALTTSYELTYSEDLTSRTLRLKNKCAQITTNDLPNHLQAKVIHIAPIASEISYEVVERLRKCCEYLSLDSQGMTRGFDQKGNVSYCAQMDMRTLPLINIYKSSLEEIIAITGENNIDQAIKAMHAFGPETVIVTMGGQGVILSNREATRHIPAYESSRVVDPTGAGDAFIGAFLSMCLQQKNLVWSACLGSAAASLVIEGVGTSFSGDKSEIYRRAKTLFEPIEIKY